MNAKRYDEMMRLALHAATKAGEAIRKIRGEGSLDVRYKSALDLVTKADLEAERIIIGEISRVFPEHRFLSEESHTDSSAARFKEIPFWVIDPVDGTTNFAHGHHQVGVSIAFCDEGEVKVGVVHAPFQSETFSAIRGAGAALNGAPIAVRACDRLEQALVATGFPYERVDIDIVVGRVRRVLKNCRDIRRIGAGSLDISWVACGRLDAFYETLQPWDIAAAILIAKEAGAVVRSTVPIPENYPLPAELFSEGIVVASPSLIDKLYELLMQQ